MASPASALRGSTARAAMARRRQGCSEGGGAATAEEEEGFGLGDGAGKA